VNNSEEEHERAPIHYGPRERRFSILYATDQASCHLRRQGLTSTSFTENPLNSLIELASRSTRHSNFRNHVSPSTTFTKRLEIASSACGPAIKTRDGCAHVALGELYVKILFVLLEVKCGISPLKITSGCMAPSCEALQRFITTRFEH
jgi:hypothetical protein